jgi:hypothetical protein
MGRVKLDKVNIPTYKVKPETVTKLHITALAMGFKYGAGAAMGAFLDMVADIDPDLLIAAAAKNDLLKQNNRNNVIIEETAESHDRSTASITKAIRDRE